MAHIRQQWKPDVEPHYIPVEDLEQEEKLRNEKKLRVRKQHEEDAKHWTYPISYATKDEIQHHIKVDALHRAESAEALSNIPDEHHAFPAEILKREMPQREKACLEDQKAEDEDLGKWIAESAKAESLIPDEHHFIPPEILAKEISHREAVNKARKYEPDPHILPLKVLKKQEVVKTREPSFHYIAEEDLELEAAQRKERQLREKDKFTTETVEYAKMLSHPVNYLSKDQLEVAEKAKAEYAEKKAKEDEIRHHAWE